MCCVCLSPQSLEQPITHAFIEVAQKDTRFDMFSPKSGDRIGYFDPGAVIPWRPEEEIPAPAGCTPSREVPAGYLNSSNEQVLLYDETLRFDDEARESIRNTNLEFVWYCPEPDVGPVVVTVNFRLRSSSRWHRLTYSLKESAVRMGDLADPDGSSVATAGKVAVKYDFDQVERHTKFIELLRDKRWHDVATFLEKKSVAYNRDNFVRRRFRVMNLLSEMFDNANGIILHNPFVFTPGVTRSILLSEVSYRCTHFFVLTFF